LQASLDRRERGEGGGDALPDPSERQTRKACDINESRCWAPVLRRKAKRKGARLTMLVCPSKKKNGKGQTFSAAVKPLKEKTSTKQGKKEKKGRLLGDAFCRRETKKRGG